MWVENRLQGGKNGENIAGILRTRYSETPNTWAAAAYLSVHGWGREIVKDKEKREGTEMNARCKN